MRLRERAGIDQRNTIEQVLCAAADKPGWVVERTTGLLGLLYEHYGLGVAAEAARRSAFGGFVAQCLVGKPGCRRMKDRGVHVRRVAAATAPGTDARRGHLRADCERCFGLCCVAPALTRSADFAIDKPACTPCPLLLPSFRCGIHDRLRDKGFPGCAAYDCFGAGQQVAQVTFGGRDWRRTPRTAAQMFEAFTIMRQLHELLWYLTEALTLHAGRSLHHKLQLALAETERLTCLGPEALLELDVAAHRTDINALLLRTSEIVRTRARRYPSDHRGADFVGKRLRRADFRAANLRGVYFIGADLGGADLRVADVAGADFRGADLSGADLTEILFLTQSQLLSASGDRATSLPPSLTRPPHWQTPSG